jgi:hypothetical protein
LAFSRQVRSCIRQRHYGYIRVYSSLCNSYKAFYSTGNLPSYESIKAPPFEGSLSEWTSFVPKFWLHLLSRINDDDVGPLNLQVRKYPITMKAGPSAPHSVWSLPFDLVEWGRQPKNIPYEWAVLTENWAALDVFSSIHAKAVDYLHRGSDFEKAFRKNPLGRLSLKYEAAGKVRVFAILDYPRQLLLRPLHEWIG